MTPQLMARKKPESVPNTSAPVETSKGSDKHTVKLSPEVHDLLKRVAAAGRIGMEKLANHLLESQLKLERARLKEVGRWD